MLPLSFHDAAQVSLHLPLEVLAALSDPMLRPAVFSVGLAGCLGLATALLARSLHPQMLLASVILTHGFVLIAALMAGGLDWLGAEIAAASFLLFQIATVSRYVLARQSTRGTALAVAVFALSYAFIAARSGVDLFAGALG